MEKEMATETKRRKIEPPPLRRIVSSFAAKKGTDAASVRKLVPIPQTHGVDSRIQQAKHFAVAQAQQEGCTGNYRIFDSPYENYLVPVVPTRAELGG